jgi:hypothetical protein
MPQAYNDGAPLALNRNPSVRISDQNSTCHQSSGIGPAKMGIKAREHLVYRSSSLAFGAGSEMIPLSFFAPSHLCQASVVAGAVYLFSVTEGGSDAECFFSLKPEGLMEISRWRKQPVEA